MKFWTAVCFHKSWLIPTVLVLLVTVVADGFVAASAQRPLLWCMLIASSLPFSMWVFVGLPLLREEKRKG
jgi:hypothetical protein